MIVKVARAFAQPVLAVARAPFSETAWTFGQLGELERHDALQRDSEGLQAANRTAMAVNEPKRLAGEHRALMQRIRQGPQRSVSEAKARARRMITAMHRGGVLDDVLALSAPAVPPTEH